MAKSNSSASAMDYNAADMPPIPTRSHHLLPHQTPPSTANHDTSSFSRHHSLPAPAAPGKRLSVPPASPEVISNLITSLSVISKPASSHFDAQPAQPSLSLPSSPGGKAGSFGVDYGAYSALGEVREDDDPVSLDEIAAAAPVIRTSKPPSGFSPLTAPKSPRSPRSPSRDSSGLRSFIRSSTTSRPSSKGSLGSKNEDAHSIGNLSIERSSNRTPELVHRRSHDSWGKKINRNSKGLMYMSSKERLREKDYERRRASTGTSGNGASSSTAQGGVPLASDRDSYNGNRNDPFLAETAISEEPNSNADMAPGVVIDRPLDSPRAIPTRDSSLRKTSSSGKRTSARRSKRDSDGPISGAIPEDDEQARGRTAPKRKPAAVRSESDFAASEKSFYWGPGETDSPAKASASASRQVYESSRVAEYSIDDQQGIDEDDGAPFPAVSQGRRRDGSAEPNSRRLSGRHSPGPNEGIRLKRSSSRLKRLSGPLSPRADDRPRESSEVPNPPRPVGYERPTSADSVDDAVESYLCSPRLSQKIRHPQTGRVISFSEVGDSEGSAVFCCVGMGLTRYITAFYDELALTLKLRLITPDRPGVGDSEPYTDGTATPLSWPDDVYAICQALKITKFSILAHSAGAIYALATALRMPQHIRGRIHLLAPWIPPSQMNVFGASQALPPTNAIPTSQRILRALPTPILKAANSSFMTATSSSITSSLPKTSKRNKRKATGRDTPAPPNRNITPSLDKENMEHGVYTKSSAADAHRGERGAPRPDGTSTIGETYDLPDRRSRPDGDTAILAAAADALMDKERQVTYDLRLTHAIWELATTNANPAVDLLVCLERRHTIGFRYVDITRPVVIHHGSRDTRVPVDNVRWLGKTMRRCEVRVLEGEGHGLMASAGVMGGVLMEMSKEWEDWIKVTGSSEGRRERGRKGVVR